MTTHSVILNRLSQKRDEEGGLERQEADCREYCQRLGLPIAAVHKEVQSAYKGKARPVLERALSEAVGGHLIVWKLDRLTRRGVTGLGQLLDRMERDNITLHSVTESIDARTPMGKAVLGVLAGVAEQSSADASLRIKRAFEEKARAGHRHAGGQRPFGWGPGEAQLVKEAADWIISGGSLRSLCKEWNARGIKTTAGGEWQSTPISRLLRNEALIAVRIHKGDRYPAEWEPILTEAEFSAVGAALRRNKAAPAGKKTLLGGMLVCGKCGGKMRGTSATEKSRRPRYTCVREPGKDNCGSNSIYRDLADAAVTAEVERVWALWEAAAPVPRLDVTKSLTNEREAIAQLVSDHYVSRLISRELFLPSYQALQDRIAELETLSAEASHFGHMNKDTSIEAKIRQAVSFVQINAAKSDQERVEVKWRFGWLNQRALQLPE